LSDEITVVHPVEEKPLLLESAYDRMRAREASRRYERLLSKLYDRKPCKDCGMLCQVCDQNKKCCLK
jgi:hypothetical protein